MDNNKLIEKLREKKHREARRLFLVEGEKNILELFNSNFEITYLALTEEFYKKYRSKFENIVSERNIKQSILADGEIRKLSSLLENDAGIAIVKQKPNQIPETSNEIVLVLDAIRDPGNLGTIIRIADWYGIRNIIASDDSTDVYNPKSIAASMGSFARVNVFYTNLFSYLEKTNLPIFGAYLDGQDVHKTAFPKAGILVIGSESHGIGKHLHHLIKNKITIKGEGMGESLNAAIASAIILDNWKRIAK